MTCREKLKIEHPEDVDEKWGGGCFGCPHTDSRQYITINQTLCHGNACNASRELCARCWDQEIPEPEQEPTTKPTEQKSTIPTMTDLQWLMRKALGYPGVTVSITFMEDVVTFNAYRYPAQEEQTNE